MKIKLFWTRKKVKIYLNSTTIALIWNFFPNKINILTIRKKNAVEETEITIENNENIENTIADDSEFRLMSKAEKRKLKKSAGKNSEPKASEKELGIEPINGNHISDNCNNDDNFQIESKAEKKKKKKLNERKFGETENKSEKLEASCVDHDRESQDEGLEVLEKDSGVKTDDILKNEDTLPALSKSQKKKKKKAAQKAAQDQNLDNNQEISESKLHAGINNFFLFLN